MGLMDGLAGWLRQIIAVLLLASLIDLLLPNRTMQRYVRLVAGLFILMTVATPVLGWIKGDFSERLADGLTQVERTSLAAPEQLALIEEEGLRLRSRRSEQAQKLAAARLASAIRTDLEASESRPVRSVDVHSVQGKDGSWTVTGVKVVFEAATMADSDSAGHGTIAEVEEIAPIAEVDIRVEVGSGAERTDREDRVQAQEALAAVASTVDESLRSRVVSLVSARYGVVPGAIEVGEAPSGATGDRR